MPSHETTELQFGHSVQPKSVGHKPSKKYRDGLQDAPLTLMSDPRVVRGSTHNLARKIAATKSSSQTDLAAYGGDAGQAYFDQLPRPTYNHEVRSHVGPDLDLSPYLTVNDEELVVRTKEVDSQTNEFQPRPPTPEYVPRKTGIDRTTQISPEEAARLFNFDQEVEPILNVIVYKTLEQALFEVEAEEELLALDAAAQGFHDARAVEMDWRRQREVDNVNEQRTQQELIRTREAEKREERRVKTTIGAVQAMRQLVPGIFEAAVEQLYAAKIWRRPEVAVVEDLSMAKTTDAMKARLKAYSAAQTVIDGRFPAPPHCICPFIAPNTKSKIPLTRPPTAPEIMLESQVLYERAPCWYDPPLPRQSVLSLILPKDSSEAPPGDDAEVSATTSAIAEAQALKKRTLGPVRIADRCSVADVLAALHEEARGRELPLELSLATLHSFFSTVVGRSIAVDGAIMNFDEKVPDELTMLL